MSSKDLQPCLFVESLKPGDLIAARFGGHLTFLTAAIGPVDKDAKVFIDGSKVKNRFARSALTSFLSAIGYNDYRWYDGIEPKAPTGEGHYQYRVVGKQIVNI